MEIAGVPVLALLALIAGVAWLYRRIGQSLASRPEEATGEDEARLFD
jgi:hypothetical protein